MAEHTYKSNDLTAVIDWDINQITSADEGKILDEALARGYNGCAYCLPEYNTD